MRVDPFGRDTEVFTVESGRDGSSCSFTVHEQVVDSWAPEVPQYRRSTVDELTRLAVAARDGNRLALGSFVRQSQGEVWRFVARLTDPSVADDVTQDVYVRAWKALPAYRADASARTWLLSIARRTCADSLRRAVAGADWLPGSSRRPQSRMWGSPTSRRVTLSTS